MDEALPKLGGPHLRRLQRLSAYPFRRLPPDLAQFICDWPRAASLAKLLECYLDITDAKVPMGWRDWGGLGAVMRGFVGALYSSSFVELSAERAYNLADVLLQAAKALGCKGLEDLRPKSSGRTSAINVETAAFHGRALDQRAVEYWHGWPIRNYSGKEMWLPLHGVFGHMGAEWTRELHSKTGAWFCTVRADSIPGFHEFADFLVRDKYTPASIRDYRGATAMWRAFWEFYGEERAKTVENRVLIADWRNHWRHFAINVLGAGGLAAVIPEDFPGPQRSSKAPHHSSTGPMTGTEGPLEGLLLDIPRHYSDTAALEYIVREVPVRVQYVRTWSQGECDTFFDAYRRRRRLARLADPRFIVGVKSPSGIEIWKTDRANPNHLSHAAATFEAYGYGTKEDLPLQLLYPGPISRTAMELALPAAGTLLPYAAMLVLEHPEITPSFLETLQLYDKRGKLTGYRVLDGGSFLIGVKNRMGEQQRIKLTSAALRALRRVVLLTHDVRMYLKHRGHDDWRYLFLSSGKGWGEPVRIKRFATFTSGSHCLPELRAQFQRHCGLSEEAAETFVARFSLRSLRATVGIKVFIDTHSEESMSKALGHKRYDPYLLARYLPKALVAFFRARWVSAFQTHIILAVTRGTGFEQRAAGFRTSDEMEAFLESNAFPRLERTLEKIAAPQISEQDGTFYFNANRETLTAIVCVAAEQEKHAEQNKPPTYWGLFSKHMLGHLESRRGLDPELDSCLDSARQRAGEMGATC